MIRKAIGCEFKIMISQLVMNEIEYNNHINEINDLIIVLKEKNKLINANVLDSYSIEAKRLSKIHKTSFNDILHFIIAKENKAEIVVTRNIKDFPTIEGFPEVVFPENL